MPWNTICSIYKNLDVSNAHNLYFCQSDVVLAEEFNKVFLPMVSDAPVFRRYFLIVIGGGGGLGYAKNLSMSFDHMSLVLPSKLLPFSFQRF